MLHLADIACLPPSIGIVTPVMKLESLEARNTIVSATSSGCPTLPNACVVLLLSRN